MIHDGAFSGGIHDRCKFFESTCFPLLFPVLFSFFCSYRLCFLCSSGSFCARVLRGHPLCTIITSANETVDYLSTLVRRAASATVKYENSTINSIAAQVNGKMLSAKSTRSTVSFSEANCQPTDSAMSCTAGQELGDCAVRRKNGPVVVTEEDEEEDVAGMVSAWAARGTRRRSRASGKLVRLSQEGPSASIFSQSVQPIRRLVYSRITGTTGPTTIRINECNEMGGL